MGYPARVHHIGYADLSPLPAQSFSAASCLRHGMARQAVLRRNYAVLSTARATGSNGAPSQHAASSPSAAPPLSRPAEQQVQMPLQRPLALPLKKPGGSPGYAMPAPDGRNQPGASTSGPALNKNGSSGQSNGAGVRPSQSATAPLVLPLTRPGAPSAPPPQQLPRPGGAPAPVWPAQSPSRTPPPTTRSPAPSWPSSPGSAPKTGTGPQLSGPPVPRPAMLPPQPLSRPGMPPPPPGGLARPGSLQSPASAPPARPPPPGAPAGPSAVPLARPPPSAAAGAPSALPLARPPVTGPSGSAGPAAGQPQLNLQRPAVPSAQHASGATLASMAAPQRPAYPGRGMMDRPGIPADTMTLQKPEAPTLRVLDELYEAPAPPPGVGAAARKAAALALVEEQDKAAAADKKKPFKRKGKVTPEMRRAARAQREATRDEKAASQLVEREEIFEVGVEGMMLIELAEKIQVDPSEIVRNLFMKGIQVNMNQVLDKDIIRLVGSEYGLLVVEKDAAAQAAEAARERRVDWTDEADIDDLVPRPPVVTVMGHVDHGKTSLLDHIRKARVAAGEAGGITQGIGAYNTTVEVDGELKTICFLDTPGHEAFSAMRARGAQVTDLVVILVAADDGVRPQTREAVAHAQAAEVPIIVAINKIDKSGADPERVKQELLELGLVPEEWGGSTPMVAVSAKKGSGVTELLQLITWTAEEKQLVANPLRPGRGTVIESHLDRRVGPVATLLVQAGTLRVGDIVSAGACYGKVRTLVDDLGKPVEAAGPGIAVQLIGLNATPQAGEVFEVAASESDARNKSGKFLERLRHQRLAEMTGGGSMVTLSSLATMDDDGNSPAPEALQKLNLIIKGDTVGVVEAIKAALGNLPQKSVTLRYLLSSSGDISESDIDLAAASGAMVVAFNLNVDEAIQTQAKRLGVTVSSYKIIYNLIDEVKAAMEGKLKQVEERLPLGKAEVKSVFGSGKKKVAGLLVLEGKMQKGATVTVKRGKTVVFEGKVSSLRRIKDNVEEVTSGLECGLGADEFIGWQEKDTVECYNVVVKNRKLEEARAAQAVDISALA